MIFLVQPWIYENTLFGVRDVPFEEWLTSNYTPGSRLVFVISLIATVLWYILASKSSIRGIQDYNMYKLYKIIWRVLLALSITGILLALIFFNRSRNALLSLTFFYIIDVVLLFCLPTATSTPGRVNTVPFGAKSLLSFINKVCG